MSRKILTVGVALVALALPTAAAAETAVFAEAKQGKLRVLSSVLLTGRAVDMMGGWLHGGQPCTTERRLRVVVEIFRTRGGATTEFTDRVTAKRMNCAEGGPNLGFQLSAAETGFDCPNGRWRPGRYDFVTRTKHLASGLISVASLGWVNREACS
jgi:hypothetical protein